MKKIFTILVLISSIICQAQSKSIFYRLNEFNLTEANKFLNKIGDLNSIQKISIVDTSFDKNQFKINGKLIFNDTLQVEQANYKSYVKLAEEIKIDEEKLNEILKTFNRIKVTEFIREKDLYIFPVEMYALSKQKGYLYDPKNQIIVGNSISYPNVYSDKILIRKKIAENWFEYESEK